jgi:quinol monooxygenase YgiN
MTEVRGIARLKIRPGKLEEFKRVAARCVESVRTKDTGTLQYELYLNDDQTEGIALESYRDFAALRDHIANLGDLMRAMQEVCTISGEILTTPTPELRKAFEGFPIGLYSPFQSV